MRSGTVQIPRFLALLLVFTLFATACGGEDSDEQSDTAVAADTTPDVSDADDSAPDTPSDASDAAVDGSNDGDSGELVEITVGRADAVLGWDPDGGFSFADYQSYLAVYSTLLLPSADGKSVEPALAESWEVDEDAMTMTFNLRPSALPDGTPITSADVAFSVGVWQEGPVWGAAFAAIDSVDTPDAATVVFNLAAIDTFLPNILAGGNGAVYPVDFAGMSKEEYYAAPVGTGPFTIESWSPAQEAVLVANQNYWAGAPAVDRLVYREYADQDTMLLAFEAGDIDVVEYVQADRADQFDDSSILAASPGAGVVTLNPNHLPDRATSDLNLRRAISLAVNRADLAAVYGGNVSLATGVLPCCVANSVGLQDGDWNQYDTEAAAEALAASEYADGVSLVLIYQNDKQLDSGAATVIQAQLADVGIDVVVEGADAATFNERLFGGDFDLAMGLSIPISPSVGDPIGLDWVTAYLFSNADMTVLEANYFAFLGALDDETRDQLVAEIEADAFEQVALIPLLNPDIYFAIGEGVSGVELTPWGFYRPGDLALAG